MKFFTPELLERYGSLDDAVADAAHEQWEEACARYQQHLKSLWRYLPEAFREFLESYALHDSRVIQGRVQDRVASRIADQRLYTIKLSPERSSDHLLLTYEIAGPPPPDKEGGCYWLYDEVDIVDCNAPRVFVHTVLFSDGVELELRFMGFHSALVSACNQL